MKSENFLLACIPEQGPYFGKPDEERVERFLLSAICVELSLNQLITFL